MGGDSHGGFNGKIANSVVRDGTTYGVLKLTLHADSYDWQFLGDGHSGTFTDSGSAACH
jgi:acid phosphatase type 7